MLQTFRLIYLIRPISRQLVAIVRTPESFSLCDKWKGSGLAFSTDFLALNPLQCTSRVRSHFLGHFVQLVRLLLQHPDIKVNMRGLDGYTALILACGSSQG